MMNGSLLAVVFTFFLKMSRASDARYTVHACKNQQVRLNCRTGRIQVVNVILADSRCHGSGCCPREGDCQGPPSATYRNHVYASCNGRASCSVYVEIANIGCSFLAPRNDHVNITYTCQVDSTSATPSTPRSTTVERPPDVPLAVLVTPRATESGTPSRAPHLIAVTSSSSTEAPLHVETSNRRDTSEGKLAESTPLETTTNDDDDDKYTTFTPSQFKPDQKSPQRKTAQKDNGDEDDSKNAAFVDRKAEDRGDLDSVTKITALIVGGLVLIAAIVSAAVVIVIKKRRVPENDEHYDMPNYPCTVEDNVRNSNFYDCIPEARVDSGHCSVTSGDEMVKENDYLRPIIEREDAAYDWIP